MNKKEQITVTSPLLPDLNDFYQSLQKIWGSKYITNNGSFHGQLEKELATFLDVPYISLFTNGTIPLLVALQALDIHGEVITTPYSFIATTHSIFWNKCTPIFVDVDQYGNLDPQKIEEAITDKTTAILPVHVYGNPCNIEEIQKIADKHNLKVIYDAAHAFAVKKDNKSILLAGDLSTLSFHATKVYNTIEGGAIICKTQEMKNKIDHLKNFGICSETEIAGLGINGKMDEIRAAYGLLNLKEVNNAIEKRKYNVQRYRELLKDINGISYFDDIDGVQHNYAYFPIFIDIEKYKVGRDGLYMKFRENNILARRYFYPLISEFSMYNIFPSANRYNLSKAFRMASEVLCLPLHHEIKDEDIKKIIEIVKRYENEN